MRERKSQRLEATGVNRNTQTSGSKSGKHIQKVNKKESTSFQNLFLALQG